MINCSILFVGQVQLQMSSILQQYHWQHNWIYGLSVFDNITYDKRTNQSINANQMTIWPHDTHAFTSVERSSTRLLWNATKVTSKAQRKNCELTWLILQIYSAKIAQMFITCHKPLSNTITNDNALVIRKYFMSS